MSISYNKKAATPASTAAAPKPDTLPAAPVYATTLCVGVAEELPFVAVPLLPELAPIIWKLAHVMRVVFPV